MADKKNKKILMQPMMLRVAVVLLPLVAASVAFFGFRALMIVGVSLVCAFFAEAAFTWRQGKPVTSAVFVTSLIFALSLPPSLPFWMAGTGAVFGVVFGKMVFGGFGFNVFNPAMVGRIFLYFSFPLAMTGGWDTPFSDAGGFLAWSPGVDAVTQATPLALLARGEPASLGSLFWGNVSGSLGETSALLILLGGAYILITKSANWRLFVSFALGGLLASLAFFLSAGTPLSFVADLLSGSFLFGAFFVITEPISGPKTNEGRWLYGFLGGALVVLLRRYSNFSEGVMFAVLFMNTFAPIMDMGIRGLKKKNPAKKASS